MAAAAAAASAAARGDEAHAVALAELSGPLMEEALELLEYAHSKLLDATRSHGDLINELIEAISTYQASEARDGDKDHEHLYQFVPKLLRLLRHLVDEHDMLDDETAELLDELLGRLSDEALVCGVVGEEEAELAPPSPPGNATEDKDAEAGGEEATNAASTTPKPAATVATAVAALEEEASVHEESALVEVPIEALAETPLTAATLAAPPLNAGDGGVATVNDAEADSDLECARLRLTSEIFATIEHRAVSAGEERDVRPAAGRIGKHGMISFLSMVLACTNGLHADPAEEEIMALFLAVPFTDDEYITEPTFLEWVRTYREGKLWTRAMLEELLESVRSVLDPSPVRAAAAPAAAAQPLTTPATPSMIRAASTTPSAASKALESPTPTKADAVPAAAATFAAASAPLRLLVIPSAATQPPPSRESATDYVYMSTPHHLQEIMASMDELQAKWLAKDATGVLGEKDAGVGSSSTTLAVADRSSADGGAAATSPANDPAKMTVLLQQRVAQLETENERLQLILVAPGQQRGGGGGGGGDADGSDALPKKEEWSLLAADLHAELAIEAAIHRAGPSDAAMALRALIEASRTVARPESSDDAMGEVTTTGLLSIEDQTRKVETMRVATEEAERVLEDAVVAHRRLVLGGDDARRAQRDVLERELHRMTDALNGGGVRGSGDPVCL